MLFQQSKIPNEHKDNVIENVVKTHGSVGEYSKLFLQKLRRVNYVTPKNYLDFIKTYTRLLDEKDQFVLEQVSNLSIHFILSLSISTGLLHPVNVDMLYSVPFVIYCICGQLLIKILNSFFLSVPPS